MKEYKYKILLAQFVSREGKKTSIPYGEGFGIDDLTEYRRKFVEQSGCTELRLTYEERTEA